MKFHLPAIAAALFCCLSCVEIDSELGGNLIPLDQTYKIYPTGAELPAGTVYMQSADSLSGYSQTRITIGAIRDPKFGLTTRSSAFTLIPVFDEMDFGNLSAVKIKRFHFAAVFDTISVASESQRHIIQNLRVHALSEPLSPGSDYDINGDDVKVDFSKSIVKGHPTLYGTDSLSFDFTEEYARRFLDITEQDLKNYKRFVKKIPGIHLSTDAPLGEGGRINMYELQVGYDKSAQFVTGNYATLNLLCDYDGDGKAETDTVFNFMYGFTDFIDTDSLFTYSTRGSYPQYCLNRTTQESRPMEGPAKEEVSVEGGGGIKPVFSALGLKHLAEDMIVAKGGVPTEAVINKATLVLPFRFPDDYRDMEMYPEILSPTCRIRQNDSTVMFAGMTDASSSQENQGDINRSTLRYEPDITYHLQELLKIKETPVSGESEADAYKRRKLLAGEYDIWLIITANEVVKGSGSSSSSMSDYYQYLAYQNYYNSMYYGGYGGYGMGYGGYGYGGYGGYGYDPYSNYYTYAMMASYASAASSSSTTTTAKLDKDRFYSAVLYGPEASDPALRPRLELTFSLSGQQ